MSAGLSATCEEAVSLGIIREDLTESSSVMATDVVPEILEAAAREGLQTTESNKSLVEWADLVVMAVKPQVVQAVIKDRALSMMTLKRPGRADRK